MITCYVTRAWEGVKNGDIVKLHPIKAKRLAAMGMVLSEDDSPKPEPKPEPKKESVAVVAKRKGRPPRVRP